MTKITANSTNDMGTTMTDNGEWDVTKMEKFVI